MRICNFYFYFKIYKIYLKYIIFILYIYNIYKIKIIYIYNFYFYIKLVLFWFLWILANTSNLFSKLFANMYSKSLKKYWSFRGMQPFFILDLCAGWGPALLQLYLFVCKLTLEWQCSAMLQVQSKTVFGYGLVHSCDRFGRLNALNH